MRIYQFEGFRMEYNLHTGAVRTFYPDGKYSHVEVNKDHAFHSQLLGITPGNANLLHELGHHVVAITLGYYTCPIVHNSALHLPMPHEAERLEWLITAISYFAMKKQMRHNHEWGAIRELALVANPFELGKQLMQLLHGLNTRNVNVTNE